MNGPLHQLSFDEHGEWIVATLAGDVDQANVAEIKTGLQDRAGNRPLIVDLTETRYLDSAGIAMLESVRRDAPLAIVAATHSIPRRVLQITAFDQLVPTFESLNKCPKNANLGRRPG